MKKVMVIGIICILIGAIFVGLAYGFGGRYVNSKLTDASKTFSSAEINKLNIEEIIANVKIFKSGDAGNIEIKAEKVIENELKCEVVNGVLKISYNPSRLKFGPITIPSFIYDWNNTSVINIYIPEGKVFDEICYTGGLGNIEAEEINAQAIIISGGAGDYNIKNMTVGSLEINGEMGNISLNGTINGDTKISGGAGDLKISGQVNGNIKLNALMGNANLDLNGNAGDYNIKVDAGLGNIRLNGNKTGTVNNGGKYTIDINASVGDININIK